MRTCFLSGILIAFISLQGHLHAATPVDSVVLEGLIAEVPPGSEWHRAESTSQQAAFERTADGQRTTLTYSTTPIAPLPDDEAFLRFAEARKKEELSKLEMVSVHYNWVQKKDVPCVNYDGIFQDKAAQNLSFLTFRGEICRHPDSAGRMIQAELAQRSNTQDAAYKIDLLGLAEQVFSTVQFAELPKESQPGR